MKAQARDQENSLSNGKKKTFHFYLSCSVYDSLIKESVQRDINISRLLEEKLVLLDKIRFEILRKEMIKYEERKLDEL